MVTLRRDLVSIIKILQNIQYLFLLSFCLKEFDLKEFIVLIIPQFDHFLIVTML